MNGEEPSGPAQPQGPLMNLDPVLHSGSLEHVELLYARYLEDPAQVDSAWQRYFERMGLPLDGPALPAPKRTPASIFNPGGGPFGATTGTKEARELVRPYVVPAEAAAPPSVSPPAPPRAVSTPSLLDAQTLEQALRMQRWVEAWRARGHYAARLDPLGLTPPPGHVELTLEHHGLSRDARDQDLPFAPEALGITREGLIPFTQAAPPTLGTLERFLQTTYAGSVGIELSGLDAVEARRWLIQRVESPTFRVGLSPQAAERFFDGLARAEGLEQFLHSRFVGAKRFSLEGGEALIPMLEHLCEQASALGVGTCILGMAHRGRLNVMTQLLQQSPVKLFAKFDDVQPPATGQEGMPRPASGDVKYHLGASTDRLCATGKKLHLSLCFNPSHLEAVNPVVEGRVRARQDRTQPREAKTVLPLLIHGDAAFIGQGVVAETLNLSGLEGYSTGGTVHIVINNQIGFTTAPSSSRSSPWCTDIARLIQAPVFHVNAEDPDAVCQVTSLALEYRQTFGQDVVIDLVCYRKYGHNESDEPVFTQPLLYKTISAKKSPRECYGLALAEAGILSLEQQRARLKEIRDGYEKALQTSRLSPPDTRPSWLEGHWAGYKGGTGVELSPPETGVERSKLQTLARALTKTPEGFTLHRKLTRLLSDRARMAREEERLDWGMGEQLAFASLVGEGYPVRLSGQDAGRGTFSHRHAVLTDPGTGARFIPLQHVSAGQAPFEVFDSALSEYAVLGFDYGYSLDAPGSLIVWEAQFGDFANGAQILIDQFLAAGEDKWRRLSGITLLLPHGFEGQGPEHSSARLERYLQLCANHNMQVCCPTTAAQLFHLLRRQMLSPLRKPLIVMSPKSLLRHRLASSALSELVQGTFQTVIGEALPLNAAPAETLLLCSGRFYVELVESRAQRQAHATQQGLTLPAFPILRIEQLYPFPEEVLARTLETYPQAKTLRWVQEEPENMGGLAFIQRHLTRAFGARYTVEVISRTASASPATGSTRIHAQETAWLLDQIFT